MHASPPFQLIVRRFGVSQFTSTLLVCMAVLASVAWAHRVATIHTAAVAMATVVLLASAVAVLIQAWCLRPVSLRWDTQRWHWGPASTAGHESASGQLMIAMDLGGWMLLRLVPEARTWRRSGTWLPVQRLGHEAAWSAFRSTVYCARPVSLPNVAPF